MLNDGNFPFCSSRGRRRDSQRNVSISRAAFNTIYSVSGTHTHTNSEISQFKITKAATAAEQLPEYHRWWVWRMHKHSMALFVGQKYAYSVHCSSLVSNCRAHGTRDDNKCHIAWNGLKTMVICHSSGKYVDTRNNKCMHRRRGTRQPIAIKWSASHHIRHTQSHKAVN